MFTTVNNAVPVNWAEQGQSKADYIEALKYEDEIVIASHNFRTGQLKGAEVEDWITQAGSYAIQPESKAGKKLIGGLRLLICERQQYSPLDFSIQKSAFEILQETFHLPKSTLALLDNDAGSFSRFLSFEDAAKTKLKSIGIALKAPQKREICNHGLALNYDLRTGFTTAFLYGTDVPHFEAMNSSDSTHHCISKTAMRDAQIDSLKNATDNHYLGTPPSLSGPQFIVSPAENDVTNEDHDLVKMIKEAISAWNHPLLLPAIFLTNHTLRTKQFCNRGKVMQETWAIEGELGVTYVGRALDGAEKPLLATKEASIGLKRMGQHHTTSRFERDRTNSWKNQGLIERGKAEELTVRINTQSLRILFTARSPQWNKECSTAMRDLLDQQRDVLVTKLGSEVQDSLRELLQYNMAIGEAVGSHVASMKERMALQLNVLYSMVAQTDNRLSARLAASAGRDSTSMKILAFITALYLPGSFVSGMFSMGMFQWPFGNQSSSNAANANGSQKVVSHDFWVYWATSIPLTALTLMGWGIWWIFEMKKFKKDYADALGEQKDSVDRVLKIAEASRRSFRNDKFGV